MPEVIKQMKERRKVEFEENNIKYQLWRLDDFEYRKLRQSSLPIKEDYDFYWNVHYSERYREDRFNLAKLFVTLTWLFGDSSDFIDNWKGSFFFPILLVLEKEQGKFFYLVSIYDHRGSITFMLYKVLEDDVDSYDKDVLHDPLESEFSRKEINYFISYFYSFMRGYFQSLKKINVPQPFLKKIDSNLILYGYKDNEYFEEHYESEESYKTAIQSFESDGVSELKPQKKDNDIKSILQTITSEAVK
ncbi:hypothetical protein [Scytonema sp. NUACC26]|uniref:hypothetical protein n=1 Tax=Scytonema sp. NUACC26 TaxID=3140176 RepID=UPI0034DB8534